MQGNERKTLDAVLVNVIGNAAFTAELANGHRLVAFLRDKADAEQIDLSVGDKVVIEVSAYDMSKGRIVGREVES